MAAGITIHMGRNVEERDMREIERYLGEALAALCSVSVSGPAVVPMGRAMAAVSAALEAVQRGEEGACETATDEA